jgi:hypothetical protein
MRLKPGNWPPSGHPTRPLMCLNVFASQSQTLYRLQLDPQQHLESRWDPHPITQARKNLILLKAHVSYQCFHTRILS